MLGGCIKPPVSFGSVRLPCVVMPEATMLGCCLKLPVHDLPADQIENRFMLVELTIGDSYVRSYQLHIYSNGPKGWDLMT